jgi:hypothetical protein
LSPGRVRLGGAGLAGVVVAEGAGEPIEAGVELVDGPAVVADDMVMSAERGQVVFCGLTP